MIKHVIFRKVWVLYALAIGMVMLLPHYKQLMSNAMVQSLSRLTPPMDYFEKFVNRSGNYEEKALDDCIYYHKRVIDFIPSNRSEAYAMMGYCLSLQGNVAKSMAAYQESYKLNPMFFWTNYNLGILYLNAHDYPNAVQSFNQAIKIDPKISLVIPTISKVYKDIILSDGIGKFDLVQSLMQGYQRAATFLYAINQGLTKDIPAQKVQFF